MPPPAAWASPPSRSPDSAGAEVFATAGSAEKRALLASLGVEHVMDSRSLDFADEIDARTGGRGVDVVLNSLSGDFIPASLRVVEPGRAVRGDRQARDLGRDHRWPPSDPTSTITCSTSAICSSASRRGSRRCSTALAAEFAAGRLAPLPHRVYPAARAADAFRFMAQARHVGKLVVTPPASAPAARIRGDATYLITGGLGALGVRTAEWLHARGARYLAVMGRSAPSPAVAERLARLELDGAVVRVIRGDVARDEDVRDGSGRDRRHAAAPARRHPRRRRPRRRGAGAPEPRVADHGVRAEGGRRVESARALRVAAARLLRRLLVDRLRARLAGPGELRRGQRLPRRAGGPAPRRGAATGSP